MSIYLFLNEQQSGPYTEDHLRAMLAAGSISPAQLAWRDGLPGWQPLNTILTIAPVPPPLPSRPPPASKLKRGLVPCKACGNPVSKSAKACPSCGAPIKRRSSCGGCLFLIVLFVIIGGAIFSVIPQGGIQKMGAAAPIATPPTPTADTSVQRAQKEANALVGLTREQLISKFGQPVTDKHDDSSDEPFEQIVFNDSKGNETFFMLEDKDVTEDGVFHPRGTVSSGFYRGLEFPAKTPDEIAADKIKPADPQKEEDDFVKTLASMGVDGAIVKSVSVEGDRLTIVVTNSFHVAPYQTRLQVAQNFEKLWAIIHPPRKGNIYVPLSLTDYNGNEVGGTGMFGVWVQKEQ